MSLKYIIIFVLSINLFANPSNHSNLENFLKNNVVSINTIDYIHKKNERGSHYIIDYHNRFNIKTEYVNFYGNLGIVEYEEYSRIMRRLHNSIYFDYLYLRFKLYDNKETKVSLAAGIISMLGGNIEKHTNYDIPRGNGLGIVGKYNYLGLNLIIENGNSKYKVGIGEYSDKNYSGSHYFIKEYDGSKGLFFIYEYSNKEHNIELNYYKYLVNFPPQGLSKEPLSLYAIGYRYDNSIINNHVLYAAVGYSDFMNTTGYAYKIGTKLYFDVKSNPIEYSIGLEYANNSKDYYNLDNTIYKFYTFNNHGKSSIVILYTDIIYNNKFYISPSFIYFKHVLFPKSSKIFTVKFRYKF